MLLMKCLIFTYPLILTRVNKKTNGLTIELKGVKKVKRSNRLHLPNGLKSMRFRNTFLDRLVNLLCKLLLKLKLKINLNWPRIKSRNASNSCKTIIKRCICNNLKRFWRSYLKIEYVWKRGMPKKWLMSKLAKFWLHFDICTKIEYHAISLSTTWIKLKGNNNVIYSCRTLRKKITLSMIVRERRQT